MLVDKWVTEGINIILGLFTIFLFFLYFKIFFTMKKKSIQVFLGIALLVVWQIGILNIIGGTLAPIYNIGMTLVCTLVVAVNIFEGKFWKKCLFSITFDAIWMLSEMLINNMFMLYSERLANSQLFGSFISKLLLFIVIVALRKVITTTSMELPDSHNILLVFISAGSIYIMGTVFMLAYQSEWKYAETFSLISVAVLLFINVLIFYIYRKLADDLYVRQMNLVYEQQLELSERHQKEIELSMQQMRDVRHNMRNDFVSILAYAEKGECGKIIGFVNDVMENGNLKPSEGVNTGNTVIDSLVGYWRTTAEKEGIAFQSNLCIPVDIPFKSADISLILGNLLENAVEGARKADGKKYIRLKIKYDRSNLLISVENNYRGELVKTKGKKLQTTKADVLNHGIGLPSVYRVAEKYHGTVSVDDSVSNRFLIRTTLYGT